MSNAYQQHWVQHRADLPWSL